MFVLILLIILKSILTAQYNGSRKITPFVYKLVPYRYKNEGRITSQRKHICCWVTKTRKGIVFPGCYPQVRAEQLE